MKIFKEHANITATANPDTIQIRFGEMNFATQTPMLDETTVVLPNQIALQMARLIIDAVGKTEEIKAGTQASLVTDGARLQ